MTHDYTLDPVLSYAQKHLLNNPAIALDTHQEHQLSVHCTGCGRKVTIQTSPLAANDAQTTAIDGDELTILCSPSPTVATTGTITARAWEWLNS